MVYGLTSLLDPKADEQTRNLWAQLDNGCNLSGIQMTPYPHFSWCVADGFQLDAVHAAMDDLARDIAPFHVVTSGLGIFTGPEPVLYISLVRNTVLDSIHDRVIKRMAGLMTEANRYYLPEKWVPHITLAYKDLTPEKLACAVESLCRYPFGFAIKVNNLSLMYQIDQTAGIERTIPLIGTDTSEG